MQLPSTDFGWIGSEKLCYFSTEKRTDKRQSVCKLMSGNSEREKKKKKREKKNASLPYSSKFSRAAGSTSSTTIGPWVALAKAVS